jgi:hypothetical protein
MTQPGSNPFARMPHESDTGLLPKFSLTIYYPMVQLTLYLTPFGLQQLAYPERSRRPPSLPFSWRLFTLMLFVVNEEHVF